MTPPTALTPEEQAVFTALRWWEGQPRSDIGTLITIIRRLDARVGRLTRSAPRGADGMRDQLVDTICARLFGEDWNYFAARPTLMDAVRRIVEDGVAVARTQHVTYSAPSEKEGGTR